MKYLPNSSSKLANTLNLYSLLRHFIFTEYPLVKFSLEFYVKVKTLRCIFLRGLLILCNKGGTIQINWLGVYRHSIKVQLHWQKHSVLFQFVSCKVWNKIWIFLVSKYQRTPVIGIPLFLFLVFHHIIFFIKYTF